MIPFLRFLGHLPMILCCSSRDVTGMLFLLRIPVSHLKSFSLSLFYDLCTMFNQVLDLQLLKITNSKKKFRLVRRIYSIRIPVVLVQSAVRKPTARGCIYLDLEEIAY